MKLYRYEPRWGKVLSIETREHYVERCISNGFHPTYREALADAVAQTDAARRSAETLLRGAEAMVARVGSLPAHEEA